MADLHTCLCALLPQQLTVSSHTTCEKVQLEASVVKASKYDWEEDNDPGIHKMATVYLLGGLEGAGSARRDPDSPQHQVQPTWA